MPVELSIPGKQSALSIKMLIPQMHGAIRLPIEVGTRQHASISIHEVSGCSMSTIQRVDIVRLYRLECGLHMGPDTHGSGWWPIRAQLRERDGRTHL